MAISLVVKGNKFEAAKAARERNIPFAFVREVIGKGTHDTVGTTDNDSSLAVCRWFCESNEAPFPAGTLLLYTHMD
jgi:hypothetical protein